MKESESKVWAAREREANKELEKELLISKKEVMEQHEKGFDKVVRQAEFFTKVLDLGVFDPFMDMEDGIFLTKTILLLKRRSTRRSRELRSKAMMPLFRMSLVYFLLFSIVGIWLHGLLVVTIFLHKLSFDDKFCIVYVCLVCFPLSM